MSRLLKGMATTEEDESGCDALAPEGEGLPPMPVEINVGPPVLTINQGSTFMVTDLHGEMKTEGELGLFASDTRFVSYY